MRFLPPSVALLFVLAPRPTAQGAEEERIGSLPLARVVLAFAEVAEACEQDGGTLWGQNLAGPVLLVDPATRRAAGNRADEEGKLAERQGVFVGTLPPEVPIANAPVEWAGVRWAMALAPFLGETRERRVALLAHESFHLLQKERGLWVFGEENGHLAELEGRVWLQLEWNALQAALGAGGEARAAAVRDALDCRAARRAHFPDAAARENAIELREGLASYTGMRIAGYSAAAVVADCVERRTREESFNRSFAYFSGPLYGYLLDEARPAWRTEVQGTSDLAAMLAHALEIEPDPTRAAAAAARHGADALRAGEEERARLRAERLAAWRAALVDGPVLVLDLSKVATGTMDTRKTHPFEEGRTVYTERKLIAKWGTLEVHDGAILEDTATRLGRISLAGAALDRLSGPGWSLAPAEGWRVVPGARSGNWELREAAPEPK